jgi:hypothetical protein
LNSRLAAISPALESFIVIPKGFVPTEAHTATEIPILKNTCLTGTGVFRAGI